KNVIFIKFVVHNYNNICLFLYFFFFVVVCCCLHLSQITTPKYTFSQNIQHLFFIILVMCIILVVFCHPCFVVSCVFIYSSLISSASFLPFSLSLLLFFSHSLPFSLSHTFLYSLSLSPIVSNIESISYSIIIIFLSLSIIFTNDNNADDDMMMKTMMMT